jgi:HEPN domain-containing protein
VADGPDGSALNRADFQELAELRLAEAECLFRNGMFDGAYHLAGYAVEAALKACIAKTVNQFDFPPRNTQRDYYTHDFEVLLKTAALDIMMANDRKSNATLDRYWKIVKFWKEDSRYEPRGSKSQGIVQEFLFAITDASDGVLIWIKKRW